MPKIAKTPMPLEPVAEQDPAGRLIWFTWIGLAISALGTLAMGTVLPFWLIDLAQKAASMMMNLK